MVGKKTEMASTKDNVVASAVELYKKIKGLVRNMNHRRTTWILDVDTESRAIP
jgi:hypothetical protein